MATRHVKRGDVVVVISGAERGNRGKIIRVLGKKDRVIVEGLQLVKRHTRKSQAHPNGAIITRESSIHISNVMLAANYDARRAKKGGVAAAPAQDPA